LTEKPKTEKRKPIGTRSSSRQYISLICFYLSASSDWLPLFRFPFLHQDVNPALGYDQNLPTNVFKRLIDQLEKRILQIDQSKIVLKHL